MEAGGVGAAMGAVEVMAKTVALGWYSLPNRHER